MSDEQREDLLAKVVRPARLTIMEGCKKPICFFPWCKNNPFRLTVFNQPSPDLEWQVT